MVVHQTAGCTNGICAPILGCLFLFPASHSMYEMASFFFSLFLGQFFRMS